MQATTLAFASCYMISATLPCHIRAVSHHLSIGQAMAGSIRSKALNRTLIILVGRIEAMCGAGGFPSARIVEAVLHLARGGCSDS